MRYWLSRLVPQALKNLYHLGRALAASVWFGFPARSMTVIGATGTNGKTTTVQMIGATLREAGIWTAVASTIDFWIRDEREVNASKFTTLDAWKLQHFLKRAHDAGCTHVVLEVGSHALDQHRVWGIPFAVAVITNVTREHLDYHQTMERYRKAKQKLFRLAQNAVINKDMEDPEFFSGVVKGQVTWYSTKEEATEVYARGIQLDFAKTEFYIGDEHYVIHLPGMFNIENALAAVATAKFLNVPTDAVRKALTEMQGVPGRMELVPNDRKIDIIIDYAVTPDAFEKLYDSVLPLKIPGTKIIHVFGACGERDRGKRPILGEIASKRADIIILTNEDPYHEDGEKIIDEIEPGVERFKTKDRDYFRIYDRKAAIKKALELSERGDIVLITGKGAETAMAIGDQRLPWSEREAIGEALF